MVLKKKWFIRESTDMDEFAKAVKVNKDFTDEKQRRLLRIIMDNKFDKVIVNGVKKRRIRKKIIKKEIKNIKENLSYKVLDMMLCEWRDLPEDTDPEKAKKMLEVLLEHANNLINKKEEK